MCASHSNIHSCSHSYFMNLDINYYIICDRLWEKGPLGSGDQFYLTALSERAQFVLSNAL